MPVHISEKIEVNHDVDNDELTAAFEVSSINHWVKQYSRQL